MMFNKLSAIALLILGISPFTAPFQTCDIADALHRNVSGDMGLTTPALTSTGRTDDEGTLIAPPGTRLRIEPLSVVAASTHVAARRVAFITSSVPPIARFGGYASSPNALRL